nr:putative RNA-directed DNA polymerase [Tanacetum cinerariifolium]
MKVPIFEGHYEHWSEMMENLLRAKQVWNLIDPGIREPAVGIAQSEGEKKKLEELRVKDMQVKHYLYQAIDRVTFEHILDQKTSKAIRDSMKKRFAGNERVNKSMLQKLRRDFEILEMKSNETIPEYFGKVLTISNQMRSNGETMTDVKIVEKILRILTKKYMFVVVSIEESKDIEQMSIEELQSTLLVHEQKFKKNEKEEEHALRIDTGDSSSVARGRGKGRSSYRGRGRGRGKGNIKLVLSGVTYVIKEVYYVPDLKNNLLSIGQLQQRGLSFLFQSDVCKVFHPEKGLVFQSKISTNRMYPLSEDTYTATDQKTVDCLYSSDDETAKLWHERLGHISHTSTKTLQTKCMVRDLPKLTIGESICEDCVMGKQTREAIPMVSSWRAKEILELVHSNICGSITPTSHTGRRSTTKALSDMTPQEAWSGSKPTVNHFCVWGCLAYVHVPKEKRTKLENKSVVCVLTGISEESKAYRLINPETMKAITSRDVIFEENKEWNWNQSKKNNVVDEDLSRARLVARGYGQEYGIDYTEVYAPMARMDTIRLMLALAAQKGWSIYQMDVKSAFLHGTLQEDVYVQQPQGYVVKNDEHKVYKLQKALYGLKQAPKAWYSRIEAYFINDGFTKSKNEHTLFIKEKAGEKQLFVNVYVDDLIFTGNDEKMMEEFKSSMKAEFEMTDLGKMRYFLVVNPIVPGCRLKIDDGEPIDETSFKQLVGSLMCITTTRPDIQFVVSFISRLLAKPTDIHLAAAKRVMRYIQGTLDYGVWYKKGGKGKLEIYTDSDFAGDSTDRKSTSGNVILWNEAAVSWSSKKQGIVALSSTEAEYVAAAACATPQPYNCREIRYFMEGANTLGCTFEGGHEGLSAPTPVSRLFKDVWQCSICGLKSRRGFAVAFKIRPMLNEIKFSSGVIDERWCLGLPRECRFNSGITIMEYEKAVQQSVYEQLQVVHEGRLKVFFTHGLKVLNSTGNVQQILDAVQRPWKCRLYAFENMYTRLVRGGNANTDKRPAASLSNEMIFNFASYNELPARADVQNAILTGEATTDRIHRRVSDIQNLSGNIIGLTLWYEMALNFNMQKFEAMERPVVIAVSSCWVRRFNGDGTTTISLTCFSDQANSLTRDCNELIVELPDKDLYHFPSTLKELKAPPVQNTLLTPTLVEQQEYMPPRKTHSPDVFRIHLSVSLATHVVVKEEINKRCKLNLGPCKLKYLDEYEE